MTGDLSSAGVDQWLARSSGGVTVTVLTDALGSPVGFGSSDGRVTGKFAYDPFGQRSIAGSLHGSDLGFTGRQVDGTGLMHYRARYYDPALGRFISEDPIGLAGGTNHYAYVNNSPANATDPTGMFIAQLGGCLAGGALEGVVSWGIQRSSGQKVNWGTVGKSFVIGCATGAIGGMWLRSRLIPPRSPAQAAADAAAAEGRTGGAAAQFELGGHTFVDISGSPTPLHPAVQRALDSVPHPRKPWHGGCAEPRCISQALDAGENPAGGVMTSVQIGDNGLVPHGAVRPPCPSCQVLQEWFGYSQ